MYNQWSSGVAIIHTGLPNFYATSMLTSATEVINKSKEPFYCQDFKNRFIKFNKLGNI